MATETTISRPAPFVEDIGKDLATQAVAMTGVPVVTGGIGSLSKMAGETAEGFQSRQDAARAFDVRKQNLAGLAPQIAGQDALQQQAQTLATQGVGSYQPFLQQAQASTGPQAFQQYMYHTNHKLWMQHLQSLIEMHKYNNNKFQIKQ